ncbi:MAG: hypothetical protein ACQCN3_09710 [Candidatus Bathyarchaeia archaeon]
MGKSEQANYIYRYLDFETLKPKTMVIEQDYIDKDYLVDFQRFYVRSFDHIKKLTTRVHFFKSEMTKTKFKTLLKNNKLVKQQKDYLGFSVIKPITDEEGNPRIGRTLLRTYPKRKDSDHSRFYISETSHVSLFGSSLTVDSVPFQAQDKGVSACATIALWTTLQSLICEYKLKSYSPAEITEIATAFPSQFRMFPQGGLTIGQMISCIRSTGLDVEIINQPTDEIITTAVKAYTYAGIPIIANLVFTSYQDGKKQIDYHAVVIVGYQCDANGKITELYVHDDNIGPFKRVKPIDDDFVLWDNSDNGNAYLEIDEIKLSRFLVPIYHKVRLSFISIYPEFVFRKSEIDSTKYNLDLLLTTIQKYKKDLSEQKIEKKASVLLTNMPRFLWIERTTTKDGRRVQDDIFDGTANIFCREPKFIVEYCEEQ